MEGILIPQAIFDRISKDSYINFDCQGPKLRIAVY